MKSMIAVNFPYGWNFYLIQFTAILNSIALRCLHLALAWWVLSMTHDAKAFALYVGIGTTSDILARGLFGSLGDSYNKHKLIVMCYWLSFISAIGIALLAFNNTYVPVILILCQAIGGLSIGIREPLQNSIVPFLVKKEQLSGAIQWRTAAMTIVFFCAPIIGMGLISIMGAEYTIFGSVFLIIVSLALLYFVKHQQLFNTEQTNKRPTWYSGFPTILRLPPEISLIKITFFMNLGLFPFLGVVLPAFFFQNFAKSPWLYGIADLFFALGMFIGAAKINQFANAKLGRASTTYLGYISLGIGILCTAILCQILTQFYVSYFSLLCFSLFIAGCGMTVAVTNTGFMRTAASPDLFLNRISSSSTFSTGIASPLGVFFSGLMLSYFGIYKTLMILSIILVSGSLMSLLSANLRKILSLSDEDMHGAYGRIYPKAFPEDRNVL